MKHYNIIILTTFTLFIYCSNKESNFKETSQSINNIQIESQNDFVYAAEQSLDAVVHIKSKIIENNIYRYYDPLSDFFYGDGYKYYNKPYEKSASGSGVLVSNDGYIVTNNHVINDAKEVEVVLNDKRVYSAEIIAVDKATDLALLKIKSKDLAHIKFADSDKVKVGQWVIAVGNPMNLNSTVTAGIISAKGRNLNLLQHPNAIESFIQTDAAINPGNSGGALVNINGELIGVNTAIQSNTGSYTGYGFAIPSNMVKKIINDLKEYGKVRRAYIGIQVTNINPNISNYLNINYHKGVLITKIITGGAAEKSKIKENDIITEIEGKKINSLAELQEQISKYSPGDIIKCRIIRDDQEKSFILDLTN